MRLLRNTLRQLLLDLKAQRMRTVLTTLGIVWGTAAVSLLLAFGQGLHHQLLKEQAGIGWGIVIAWPSQTSMPFEGLGKGRRIRLDDDDMTLVRRRVPELGTISSEYEDNLKVQTGRRTLAVDVSGVQPGFGEMRNIIPQAGGRFLDPIDETGKRRVAFLGNELAEQLFGTGEGVGQQLRIHGSPFTVVGVMEKKEQNSSYSGRDKDKIFIPAATMQALTGQEYLDDFIFRAKRVEDTKQVTDEVRAALAAKHRFDPDDKEALSIWDTSEGAKFINIFMLAFQIFLGVVGSLTLVVGGIGVSNIMNVVVEERTREIGIKMALGARGKAVLGQFLLETFFVTAVGGAIGFAITAGICAVFPALGMSEYVGDPTFSPLVGVITAALLGVIGLIAGYFPARTASSLDPVVAMKM